MDLYIPVEYKGSKYVSFEIGKLKAGVIADATEEMSQNGAYPGMLKLVSGALKSMTTEEGEEITRDFDPLLKRVSIQAIEIMALKALTQESDEGIEIVSICPRCKKRTIYEDIGEEGDDDYERNALRFEDLDIVHFAGDQKFSLTLEEPVQIKSKGETIAEVNEIEFRFPTLADAIKGSKKVSENKEVRKEYSIYAQAIEKINGDPVDQAFISSWGVWLMDKLFASDIGKFSKALKQCGIQKTIKRECHNANCGKRWNDRINLSGFFENGLQL